MKMRLTLVQFPPAQGGDVSRDLGTGRLVIGRGPDCDWVLNDPDRLLSKNHCMVEFKGGVYLVIDSSTNGVFLNDGPAPIGRGNTAVLNDGDRLRMGGFVMRAGFAADEAPAANDPFLAVLRGNDSPPPAAGGAPAGDPFAFSGGGAGFGSVPVMAIPDDDDLFGDPPPAGSGPKWGELGGDERSSGGVLGGGGLGGGWQPTAADGGARASSAEWPGAAQTDFSPGQLGTMRVAPETGTPSGAGIPDDWLDDPVDLAPPAAAPANAPPAPSFAPPPFTPPASSSDPFGAPDFGTVPPPPSAPSAAPAGLPDDWDDGPLVPPAFAPPGVLPAALPVPAPAPVPAPSSIPASAKVPAFDVGFGGSFADPSGAPGGADASALTRALMEALLTLVRQQAALEATLRLDPEDTLAQADVLRRAADAGSALERLRAMPPGEAEALLRAVAADGTAHQSALLAAVRELTGETADGGARLSDLYRRLLPIHRQALGA